MVYLNRRYRRISDKQYWGQAGLNQILFVPIRFEEVKLPKKRSKEETNWGDLTTEDVSRFDTCKIVIYRSENIYGFDHGASASCPIEDFEKHFELYQD